MTSSNLEMFLYTENDANLWNDEHIAAMRKWWKKLTPDHKLYEYNKNWHVPILEKRSERELKFIANAKIPHLSQWAKELLQ